MAREIRWRGDLSPDRPGDVGRAEKQAWRPGTPLVPPKSIVDAVRLMQFGAFLNVLEIVRGFLTRGDLRTALAAEAHQQGLNVSATSLDKTATILLTLTTLVAVASALVWYSMSRATARGSKWGRIIACVLFVLALLGFFGGLLPTAGLFHQVFALSLLLVGGWALVRLWHRDSSAWITYQTNAPE
jgi:hypothetical protein